ncbi:hypothetical protein [Rufibacter aurantiacus]|uniref:hypothetical protein n=1 Tax=Rufibacter aurantiacus TaxID=2817374 RepID=UPI001B30E1FD|nr:hypothetical protein [Rufibacter aurantiacus]
MLLSTLIAGIYGIIHNQITYSISSEFFTKVLFYRFGVDEYFMESPRLGAAIIGVWSSWWMGLLIGIMFGIVGCLHENTKIMLRQTLKAIVIAIIIAFFTPFMVTSYLFLPEYLNSASYMQYEVMQSSEVPHNMIIQNDFLFYLAAQIHNYSYVGGLLGLIVGVSFLILNYKKSEATVIMSNN